MIALSDETPEVVEPYLRRYDLGFPVGAGSTARQRYGARGIPHAVLIDGQGRIVWRGHPNQLTDAQVRSVLETVDPLLRERSVTVEGELEGRAARLGELARAGSLREALEGCAELLAHDEAGEAERAGAARVRAAIVQRLEHWVLRARSEAEAGRALEAARSLSDVLALVGEREESAAARELLERLRESPAVARELDAEALLAKALELSARRGPDRARTSLEAIVRDFPGTRAADRARSLLLVR